MIYREELIRIIGERYQVSQLPNEVETLKWSAFLVPVLDAGAL